MPRVRLVEQFCELESERVLKENKIHKYLGVHVDLDLSEIVRTRGFKTDLTNVHCLLKRQRAIIGHHDHNGSCVPSLG